jgi:hypothetical protein
MKKGLALVHFRQAMMAELFVLNVLGQYEIAG